MSKVVNEHNVRKTLLLNPEKLRKVRMILGASSDSEAIRMLERVDELFNLSNRSLKFYLGFVQPCQVRNFGYNRISPNSSTDPN